MAWPQSFTPIDRHAQGEEYMKNKSVSNVEDSCVSCRVGLWKVTLESVVGPNPTGFMKSLNLPTPYVSLHAHRNSTFNKLIPWAPSLQSLTGAAFWLTVNYECSTDDPHFQALMRGKAKDCGWIGETCGLLQWRLMYDMSHNTRSLQHVVNLYTITPHISEYDADLNSI